MDQNDDGFPCDCGGKGPPRFRVPAVCGPGNWTMSPDVEKISWAELYGSFERFAAGYNPVTTTRAIIANRAAARGECARCGRTLPAPEPVPGRLVEWHHLDNAGREVVDFVGEPRDWLSGLTGPRRYARIGLCVFS